MGLSCKLSLNQSINIWFSYGFPMVFLWFEMILLGICVPVVAVKFWRTPSTSPRFPRTGPTRCDRSDEIWWSVVIRILQIDISYIYIYLYIYIHSIVIRISSKHPQSLNSHGVSPQTVSPRVPVDRSQPTSAGVLRQLQRFQLHQGRCRLRGDVTPKKNWKEVGFHLV